MSTESITIIGSGPLALSVAAQFASLRNRKKTVSYIDLSKNEKLKATKRINIEGVWQGSFPIDEVSFSLDDIRHCGTLVVAVAPSRFDEVFEHVLRIVEPGMKVLFFPASFGAQKFKETVPDPSAITIAESVSYPYVCAGKDGNTIITQSKKSELRLSVLPRERESSFIKELNEVFEIFTPAKNFMETSLDNINLTLHPLPVLLNIGGVENNKAFRHYIDGVSPTVGRMIDALDKERMEIGKAIGVNLTPALQQLKTYYGDSPATNLYEYVSNKTGPYATVGRFDLNSRYVREDIPFLLIPAIRIAQENGVEVPVMRLCAELADAILGTSYLSRIP